MNDVSLDIQDYAFPEDHDDQRVATLFGLMDYKPLEKIDLKAPQKLAIAFGKQQKRYILSLDKGMGKTLTYLTTMQELGVEKFIILCSTNAELAQERELVRHFPQYREYVFIDGPQKKRAAQWANPNTKVFISTYACFQSDMGGRINQKTKNVSQAVIAPHVAKLPMICDEFHKVLRRKTSGTYKLLKTLHSPVLILSSGSAKGKGPQDLWAALNVCNPKKFSSYWNYVFKFCIMEETRFGRSIVGVKNIEEWRKHTSSNIFHRLKDAKDYPLKTRLALEVRMSPETRKLHDQLQTELWANLDLQDGSKLFLLSPNTLAATMKLRQLLVCPKILDERLGYGDGLEGIYLDATEAELTHWVISTPFRKAIPYISQFFVDKGYAPEVLAGSTYSNAQEIRDAITRWTIKGGPIIQTIKFAESYELPAARIMYMLGYEYSAEENSQAEDRIHRDIRVTPHPVDIYYVKHQYSYDGQLIEMMSQGADNAFLAMDKPLNQILTRPHSN